MTTYNTMNPVPSADARDRYDNSQVFDEMVTGAALSTPDRKGVSRKTWKGIEADFAQFLLNSGYEFIGDYDAAGELTFTRPNQIMSKSGEFWRPGPGLALPYTTVNNWAVDQPKFVSVGDAALRQALAASSGDALVGSTRPDSTVTTVAVRLDNLDEKAQTLLGTTADIIAAFPDGGSLYLRDGVYSITEPLVVDYSTPTSDGVDTSFPGYLSKRYNLQGESQGNTIILASGEDDFAIKMLGSVPVTQNVHAYDQVTDLTISNPDRVTANTEGTGMSGLLLRAKAYTRVANYAALNLNTGLQLDGVLTSTLEDINITGCYRGIVGENTGAVSGPNATIWSRVKIGLTSGNGVDTDVGAAHLFNNLTVEGCGTFLEASPTCGAVLRIPANQLGGNVVMVCPYFELNKGLADIFIDNQSTYPVTVTIIGGIFTRAGLEYTKTNIQAHSSGGGTLTVILKGVTFRSVSGYVPSADRPYWIEDSAVCHVIADEYCNYNETDSMGTARRFSAVTSVIVNSAGTRIAGSTSVLTQRLGVGSYRFNSLGTFGVGPLDYAVVAMGCDSGSTGFGAVAYCRVTPANGSQFDIYTYNQAGALVDGPISVMISSLRGGY